MSTPRFARMCAILLGLVAPAGFAQIFQNLSVPSTSNIFGSGNPNDPTPHPGGGGGGTVAPGYSLNPGTGRYMETLSVTGHVSLTNWFGTALLTVPDGLQDDGTPVLGLDTDIFSYHGISGIGLFKGSGFLAGVFLNDTIPQDPAPDRLLFTNNGSPGKIGVDFATLSPRLNQMFFIGDGLTGNGVGARQRFNVPDGATRLFLGYADADNYHGLPGQYQDNTLGLTVSLQVVPEPTAALACLALLGAAARARRR